MFKFVQVIRRINADSFSRTQCYINRMSILSGMCISSVNRHNMPNLLMEFQRYLSYSSCRDISISGFGDDIAIYVRGITFFSAAYNVRYRRAGGLQFFRPQKS